MPASSGFAFVVEIGLWDVFDEGDEEFYEAEGVDLVDSGKFLALSRVD